MSAAELWLLFAACVVCVAATWAAAHVVHRRGAGADEWMPRELKDHTLAYSEKTFRSGGGDRQVAARVDRAYRGRNGLITLVELKTRRADSCSPVRRHRTFGAAGRAGGRDAGACCSHRVGCRGVGRAANGPPGHPDVAADRLGTGLAARGTPVGHRAAQLPGYEQGLHIMRLSGPMPPPRASS